jgi:two-component system, sensor histidine kinase YesM
MKVRRIRMRLIIAMLLTTAIPLLFTSVIIIFQVSQSINDMKQAAELRVKQDMVEKLSDLENNLYATSYLFYYNRELVQSLRNNSQYEPDNSYYYDTYKDTQQFLTSVYNTSPVKGIVGIYLVNSANKLLGSYLAFKPVTFKGIDEQSIVQLAQTIQAGDGPKVMLSNKNHYQLRILQYAFPLKYMDDHIGLLVIDVDEVTIRRQLEKYNTSYHGQVILSDAKGTMVYHTDVNQIGLPFQASNNIKSGFRLEVPLPNGLLLTYEYYTHPNLLLYRNLAIAMVGLSCILAIIISLVLSYNITKPIINLHGNMVRVQNGDYSARAEIMTNDEIGFLGKEFNRMVGTIQHLIEHDFKLQLVNKEIQIKALQAQISPHFLHNTLQTMSNIAMIHNAPEVKLICQCLSNMYRYNMNIHMERVALKEELKHIRNYLLIINKRYPDNFKIRLKSDEEIRNMEVPKLILQPIIENALEHGLIPSRNEKRLLKVYASKDEKKGLLYIYVIDNGAGMSAIQLEELMGILGQEPGQSHIEWREHPSIGLTNVQKRINLLCGNEFGLSVLSKEGKGTCVILKLPLKEARI